MLTAQMDRLMKIKNIYVHTNILQYKSGLGCVYQVVSHGADWERGLVVHDAPSLVIVMTVVMGLCWLCYNKCSQNPLAWGNGGEQWRSWMDGNKNAKPTTTSSANWLRTSGC